MSKKITVEIDVPEFEGYEFVRYGMPLEGEFYLSPNSNMVLTASRFFTPGVPGYSRPVYRKAIKWRPATLADVQRALDGETVVARFADFKDDWTVSTRHLVGVTCTTGGRRNWYSNGTCYWNHCEVLESE